MHIVAKFESAKFVEWEVMENLPDVSGNSPFCTALTIDDSTVRFWSNAVVIDMTKCYLLPLIARMLHPEFPFPEINVSFRYGLLWEPNLPEFKFSILEIIGPLGKHEPYNNPRLSVVTCHMVISYEALRSLWKLLSEVKP